MQLELDQLVVNLLKMILSFHLKITIFLLKIQKKSKRLFYLTDCSNELRFLFAKSEQPPKEDLLEVEVDK